MANSQIFGNAGITADKLNEITIGDTAPTDPAEGWLWVNTSVSGQPDIYIYNGTSWEDATVNPLSLYPILYGH